MLLQFLLTLISIGCCWFPCCKPAAKPCPTPTVTHCQPACGTIGYPHPYAIVVHPVIVTPVQKDMPKVEPKKVEPPKKTEEPKKVEPPKKTEEPKKVDPPKKDEPKKDEPKKL